MSDTVPYSDLYPWIMPEVPNCPAALIDQELFNALRDFCRDTHAWNEVLPLMTLRAAVTTYPIDSPHPHGKVWSVMYAERNGRRMRPAADYHADPCTIILTCAPGTTEANALGVRVAYEPVFGQQVMARCVFETWGNKIAVSVKSRLMLMPGKTWTSERQGAMYRSDAYNEFANAKIKVMNEMSTNKEGRVRPLYRFA